MSTFAVRSYAFVIMHVCMFDRVMITKAAFSGLLATVAAGLAHAQDTYEDRVRAAMLESVGPDVPAVALAVVKSGEVVFADAVGAARIQARLKADAMTLFSLGTASRVVSRMALARLVESKALDLDSKINQHLAPLLIKDANGVASAATLRDVLSGKVRTPHYLNEVPRAELGRWTVERALRENCWIEAEYGSDTGLSWAIVQRAVERATNSTWRALVASQVAEPLRLPSLHGDLSAGRPANSVDPYSKGTLGLPAFEPNAWSSFVAERGAWIGARDLGRLLLELSRYKSEESGEAGVDELCERPELRDFGAWLDRDRWSIRFADGCSGSTAVIQIYPDFDFAFAYLANRVGRNVPESLWNALRSELPEGDSEAGGQWNTAVGLGGGAGGRRGGFDEKRRGDWDGTVRLHDEDVSLEMRLGSSGISRLRIAGELSPGFNWGSYNRRSLHATMEGLGLARGDLENFAEVDLDYDSENDSYRGFLRIRGEHCHMKFPVRFHRRER